MYYGSVEYAQDCVVLEGERKGRRREYGRRERRGKYGLEYGRK